MRYLVVNDVEDRGVYRFDSFGIAKEIAANFKNYVFMYKDEKEKALELAGVDEVTDALFLIKKYKTNKNNDNKLDNTQKENNKNENTSICEHPFINIFNKLKELGNTISICLVNGETYVFSVKSYFLKMAGYNLDNLVNIENGLPKANEIAIKTALEEHAITILSKSKVEFVGNYMLISNCDDKYSPNHVDNPFSNYEHQYEKVAIDMNAVASASIVSDFNFGSNKIITSDVVVKYLIKNAL